MKTKSWYECLKLLKPKPKLKVTDGESLNIEKINELVLEFEKAIPHLDISEEFDNRLYKLCKDVKENVNA